MKKLFLLLLLSAMAGKSFAQLPSRTTNEQTIPSRAVPVKSGASIVHTRQAISLPIKGGGMTGAAISAGTIGSGRSATGQVPGTGSISTAAKPPLRTSNGGGSTGSGKKITPALAGKPAPASKPTRPSETAAPPLVKPAGQ